MTVFCEDCQHWNFHRWPWYDTCRMTPIDNSKAFGFVRRAEWDLPEIHERCIKVNPDGECEKFEARVEREVIVKDGPGEKRVTFKEKADVA